MIVCLATVHRERLFMPLALLYLERYLVERKGFPADAIDIAEFSLTGNSLEMIATRILEREPDVVGLSCYVWNITTMMDAVKIIKSRRPQTTVVLGGPEVGPVAMSLLEAYPAVDAIVKSEGEIPFSEIVERLSEGRSLHDVAGICFRDNAALIDTGDAPLLEDLGALPSPHLAVTSAGRYSQRIVCLETQRGCVFKCNFCFYNKDFSLRNRRFDLERVKRELLRWLDEDIYEIYLMDPVFNLNAARAKEICAFIAANNRRRVTFHTELWAEFMDDELARLMRDANFTFVEVGLQTTDVTALATVERRLKLDKFLSGINHLKSHGIEFELQLIYGLPGETSESFRKSLEFAVSLDPPRLAVFPLMVLPGTELWRKADAIGLDYEPTPPYYARSHYTMNRDEIAYGWKIVGALKTIGDSKAVRLLGREPGVRFLDVLDAWIASDRPVEGESPSQQVQRFLSRFCGERGIPPAFYQQFAAREFLTSLA
ncbi:MAG TPA: radical SAM protein [Vicinamibacterales bacterium]|nr:radical SAM protein [Vicinamibacterales bacterium]